MKILKASAESKVNAGEPLTEEEAILHLINLNSMTINHRQVKLEIYPTLFLIFQEMQRKE